MKDLIIKDYNDLSGVSTDKLRKILDVKGDDIARQAKEIELTRQEMISIRIEISSRGGK